VYGLALGYEDLNDHDQLRTDSLLGVLAGKSDPCGEDRLGLRCQAQPDLHLTSHPADADDCVIGGQPGFLTRVTVDPKLATAANVDLGSELE